MIEKDGKVNPIGGDMRRKSRHGIKIFKLADEEELLSVIL
jgi:hypothetical protein